MDKSNLQMLVSSAKGFFETGIYAAKKIAPEIESNKYWEIVPTAVMNLNFSAELFLKFICFHFEVGDNIWGHNILELYKKIPSNVKNDLETEYNHLRETEDRKLSIIKLAYNTDLENLNDKKNHNNIEDLTINRLLEIHHNSFNDWRYHFEEKSQYGTLEYNFDLMSKFIQSILNVFTSKNVFVVDKKVL